MRLPTHLHITWQDENTLKIDADYGTQTRLLHFGPPVTEGRLDYSNATLFPARSAKLEPPAGTEPSSQGYSSAQWTVMTPNRILQVFQSEHRIRMLWTDGRALPSGENLENLGPAWYGHSVGKWNGNTLTVNTVGLDDRAWLDSASNPKSFHARIEETWRRVDFNTLEMQLTLYDPEFYTATYVGSKKIYKRTPNDAMTYFGWSGIFAGITESICAPMNEVEGYNKFRDLGRSKPAGQ